MSLLELPPTRPSTRRFAVLQMGARMHYAVPALLAQQQMLERLYTDIHAEDPLVKGLRLIPAQWRPKPIKRLLGRVLPAEVPRDRVTTCASWALLDYALTPLRQRPLPLPQLLAVETVLEQRLLNDNFAAANALYVFTNGALEVCQQAKQQGLQVVMEQILNPDVGFILRTEREQFPGIELQDSLALVEAGVARDRALWALCDRVLAPSDFVRQGILDLGGRADNIALVPYGIDASWFTQQPTPVRGQVLFVGSVGLRKGNHYLAAATRILQQRGVPCDVRVVGPYDPEVIDRDLFRGPTYVGQVPRSEVMQEFLQADLFVLPTLSEGCALVHLEALACGVPVITTPNCGSVVQDGVEGFIVPIRDAEALADRMEQVLTNGALRQSLSAQARLRAQAFTWSHYCQRLMNCLQTLAPAAL